MIPGIELHPERAAAAARRRRTALLIELLGDDSPVVVSSVRAELDRLGPIGAAALRRAARSGPPRVRARARQVLLDAARQRTVRRLARYAARRDHDLESALFLLSAHGAPGEDLRPYRRVLDAFGDEVRGRLARGARPADALRDYLAGVVGFAGAREDYHHPDNVYLHRALERRAGMPLTLCAIYAAVARRAGIETGLLPLPGHVLLAVLDDAGRTVIDPFGGGAEVDRARVRDYLRQHGLSERPDYLRSAGDGALFLRQIANLTRSLVGRGRRSEARQLDLVARVLVRSLAPARPLGRAATHGA